MRAELDRKLRAIHVRCSINLLLQQSGGVLLAAGAGVVLAVMIERALAIPLLIPLLFSVLGVAAAAGVAVLWLIRRPTRMQVALLADRRLGFHERFSTALALAGQDDAFAQAAVEETRQAVQHIRPKERFPVRPCRRWIYAIGTWALAGGLALFLPSMDLLGYLQRRQDDEQRTKQIAQAKTDVQQAVTQIKSVVKQLPDPRLAEALAGLDALPEIAEPQVLRRQAIRKLGDLAEQLQKRKDGPQMASARMMEKMLRQLRSDPKGLSRDLNRALAKADFSQAGRIIQELQKKLAEGKLSEEQKEALTRQLRGLARQLRKLSEMNDRLGEELEKAGLDKNLAKLNDKDLRDALRKAGFSEAEIDKLLEKLSSSRLACSRMARLGEACSGSGSGGELLAGEELAELAEQLDELEAMQLDLALTEASLEEIEGAISSLGEGDCKGGATGPWSEGLALRQGSGTGGPGRGYGARPTEDGGETSTKKTRVKNKPKAGPVIASSYFKGPQVKGESKRQLTNVVQAGKDRSAEAISENRIPRRYEESVKRYFGRLEELSVK